MESFLQAHEQGGSSSAGGEGGKLQLASIQRQSELHVADFTTADR
jgi:hypothetical protein